MSTQIRTRAQRSVRYDPQTRPGRPPDRRSDTVSDDRCSRRRAPSRRIHHDPHCAGSDAYFELRAADTRRAKLAAAVSLWVVAAGSKLVVLELVDLVFGEAVSLGGFVPVTLLVLALLGSRAAVRHLRG